MVLQRRLREVAHRMSEQVRAEIAHLKSTRTPYWQAP